MTTVYHHHATYGTAPAALPPFDDDGGNYFALYVSIRRIFSGEHFPSHPTSPPSLCLIILPWRRLCYSIEAVAAARNLLSQLDLSVPPEFVLSVGGTVYSMAVRAIDSFYPCAVPRILPLHLQITAESSSSPYPGVELTNPLTCKTSCGGDFDDVDAANDHLHQSSSVRADLDHDHVNDDNGDGEAFRSVLSSTESAPCNDQIGQNESTVTAASSSSTESITKSSESESESEEEWAPKAEPDWGRKSPTSGMGTESIPNSEESESESGSGGGEEEATVDFDRAPAAEPDGGQQSQTSSTESIPDSEEPESESRGGEEEESTVDFDRAPAAEPYRRRRLVRGMFRSSFSRLSPLDYLEPEPEPDRRRRLVGRMFLYSLVEDTLSIWLHSHPSLDYRSMNVNEDADHDDNADERDDEVVDVVDDNDDDDNGHDVFEDDWETGDDELTAAPASQSAIRSLEELDTEALAGVHNWCTVCQEDFAVPRGLPDGEDVIDVDLGVVRIPCGHVYHRGCIVTWLETRHSCPLCRFALPTSGST